MQEQGHEILEQMLGYLGFVFKIEEEQEQDHLCLNIIMPDSKRLIGRDGRTLDDLQYLMNRLRDQGEKKLLPLLIDVEGYRKKEKQQFLEKIEALAQNVLENQSSETIGPINSFQRRLVHHHFEGHPEIKTESEPGDSRLKTITLSLRNDS